MKLALILATKKAKIDIQPPLGLAYLAAYLSKKRNFHNTKIFTHVENVITDLDKFRPDLIGISCVTYDYPLAVELAKEIKKKFRVPVVLGGVHISLMPESLNRTFDIAVLGEGEETFLEIFDLFYSGEHVKAEALEEIKGIAFYKNDKLHINPRRELIETLDGIPYPARYLLRVERLTHMITSRGCPYKCAYCSSAKLWQRVRFFSAEYVAGEIEELINKYKVKHISLWDDLFTVNKSRLRKIVEILKNKKLTGKVTFGCNARANLIDEEICQLLKEMNVTRVSMGLESGSEKMLAKLKGGNVSVNQNFRAVELCKKFGIIVKGSFIIGSPTETKEDIFKTIEFIEKSQLDGGGVFIATPYPGTDFWNYALSKNIVSSDMDFSKLNPFYTRDLQDNILLIDEKVIDRKQLNRIYLQINKLLNILNAKRSWRLKDLLSFPAIATAIKNPRAAFLIILNILRYRFVSRNSKENV